MLDASRDHEELARVEFDVPVTELNRQVPVEDEEEITGGRSRQAKQHPQRRRLPSPVRTKESRHRARHKRKRQRIDRDQSPYRFVTDSTTTTGATPSHHPAEEAFPPSLFAPCLIPRASRQKQAMPMAPTGVSDVRKTPRLVQSSDRRNDQQADVRTYFGSVSPSVRACGGEDAVSSLRLGTIVRLQVVVESRFV